MSKQTKEPQDVAVQETPEIEEVLSAPKAPEAPKAPKKPKELTEEERSAQIEAYMHEEVEIELFYDNEKYKDDVEVSVNGKTWLIKRGVKVKVPRFVAQVIADSQAQDKASAVHQRSLANEFEGNMKKYLGQTE